MRVIDRKIRDGIRNLKPFKRGSSELCICKDEMGYLIVEYLLHHNRIAVVEYNDANGYYVLWIRDCGWRTRTTKDRLNAILSIFGTNCYIYQKNHEWYLTYSNGTISEYWIGSAKILLGIDPFIKEIDNENL